MQLGMTIDCLGLANGEEVDQIRRTKKNTHETSEMKKIEDERDDMSHVSTACLR